MYIFEKPAESPPRTALAALVVETKTWVFPKMLVLKQFPYLPKVERTDQCNLGFDG